MSKIRFHFAEGMPIDSINSYYDSVKKAITTMFSPTANNNYAVDFCGLSLIEIQEEQDNLYDELEIEATLCLIAYLESLFRTDFIVRCELKKRDVLSRLYRAAYNPIKAPYTYSFKEFILENWKKAYPNEKALMDRIIEMMNFRHWIAHGRYWMFKDNPNKFTYSAVYHNIKSIESHLSPLLCSIPPIGNKS